MSQIRSRIVLSTLVIGVLLLPLSVATALSATFDVVREQTHGNWRSVLYKNRNGGRHFCALETDVRGTTFRINQYKDTKDTFLELYNPSWTMMEGNVGFSLKFERQGEPIEADLRGKSWGDSYTYDILDQKIFDALMVLVADSRSVALINSNSSVIEQFSLKGSGDAVKDFLNCTSN